MNELSDNAGFITWWMYLLPIVLIYAVGVYMGSKGSIVVYRNFFDVMIVGLLYMIPLVGVGFIALIDSDAEGSSEFVSGLFVLLAVLELAVLIFVLVRTWFDNRNPLKMLLALFVKLPTGIFFFSHFYNMFTAKNRHSRRKSAFWFIFMMPLFYALVHDKSKNSTFMRVPKVR